MQKAEQDFATFSHSLMKRYSFILSDHHSVLNGEGNSTNRGFDSENDSTRTDPLRERLISVLTAEDLSEFKALESNYHERKSSYKRAHEESNEYADQLQMENEKHKQIIEWMHEVQNLIWPDNTYHAVQGKPLGATLDLQKFNVDVTDRSSSVCETDHLFAANDIGYYSSLTPKLMNLLAASTALLPHSLLPLFTSVQHLGIIKVHDVLTIVDCYRMMGWTSISLQLLRGSPTTKALQLLIDVGQSIQSTGVDHSKIVRFLENMLTRGRYSSTHS